MSIDGFIAILGLLIAAYQIMPRIRQMELRLRFQTIDGISLVVAFALVVYLLFYSTFASVGFTPRIGLNRWHITPERGSFLVALIAATALWMRFKYARLSPTHVHRFSALLDELLRSEKSEQLILLLNNNFEQLMLIAENKVALSKIRSILAPPKAEFLVPRFQIRDNAQPTDSRAFNLNWRPAPIQYIYDLLARFAERPARSLSGLLPSYVAERAEAQRILHKILTTRSIADAIVQNDPYFGLRLLNTDLRDRDSFLANYLNAQLNHSSSVLYDEMRDCQQPSWNRPYQITEPNKLLLWLFSDARVAEKMEVYRPVGESIIAHLEDLSREPAADTNNFARDRAFEESGRWESPVFVAVIFFDIMVTSAFHQQIRWHMWLYYLMFFAERIIKNCSPRDPAIGPADGSRTRYGYFLYDIFVKLRDWARLAENVEDLAAASVAREDENDNIPKCSMNALAGCLKYLIESDKFEPTFKNEILSMVYDLYFDFRYAGRHRYAQFLARIITSKVAGTAENLRILQQGYDEFDKVPHRLREPAYVVEFEAQPFLARVPR